MTTITPIQIMPAYNWYAVFQGKNEKKEDVFIHIPLVCWALSSVTEEGKGTISAIHGMIPDDAGNVISAKLSQNFLGYEMEADEFEIDDDDGETGSFN